MLSVQSIVWALFGVAVGIVGTTLILSGQVAQFRASSKAFRESTAKAKVDCDEWRVKAEYFEFVNKELAGVAVERDLFRRNFLEIDDKFSRRSSPREHGKFAKKTSDERVQNIR